MSPSHGSEDADPRRLRELADFLRDRRSRLDPDELGLPARRRRRTAGLRREDIAERAAVSVAWYTNLEQARPVKPSKAVIAALADALCLDDDDRAYLHRLAGHASPTTSRRSDIDRAVLQTLVDGVPYPAYCTDALTNVIAWNAAAALVFGDYAAWPAEQRNLLLLLFTETGFGQHLVDRDDYSQRVVRAFRGRSDAYLNDPTAIELVASLRTSNERFKDIWDRIDIRRSDIDHIEVRLPRHGPLTFTLSNWQAVAAPTVRFNAYLPTNESARHVFASNLKRRSDLARSDQPS